MTEASPQDKLRAILALLATIGTIVFNALATTGRVNGITPADVSARYETVITPAGYAFSIWSLIYLGILAFSVYQILPRNTGRFRGVRTLFIASCVLNCGWIFFWHQERIGVCLVIIIALAAVLGVLTLQLRGAGGLKDALLTSVPFGLYFGWVSCAMLVNLMVWLQHGFGVGTDTATTVGIVLLLLAGAMAVIERVTIGNFIYPLGVAWALAAVAVKQSGHTAIVVAAVVGSLTAMLTAGSVVTRLKDSTSE